MLIEHPLERAEAGDVVIFLHVRAEIAQPRVAPIAASIIRRLTASGSVDHRPPVLALLVAVGELDALGVLAGVDDIGAHHFDPAQRSDPAAALRGAPTGAGARILLAHQPSSAAAAATAGFDVQISGHTHGGQFWPWNHFVRFFQPFTAGLHRLKDLWVYVSRGTGYWGPPNRFGVPAEITRIRLVAARP